MHADKELMQVQPMTCDHKRRRLKHVKRRGNIWASKTKCCAYVFVCVIFLISMLSSEISFGALWEEGFCSLRPQSGAHSAGPKVPVSCYYVYKISFVVLTSPVCNTSEITQAGVFFFSETRGLFQNHFKWNNCKL